MEQYIPKSAVLAEIERLIKKNELYLDENASDAVRFQKTGTYSVLCDLRHFINVIEVKVVDLEGDVDKILEANDWNFDKIDFYQFAKHFFELGLKAQHSSIGIPNIDDIFEEEGIDPNSKDAKIFKEFYYMALEKLKAQKGE